MTECEVIQFIQKAFEFAVKVAEQTGIHDDKNYDQARNWLEQKLSEAAAQEVSEMKKERKKNGKEKQETETDYI